MRTSALRAIALRAITIPIMGVLALAVPAGASAVSSSSPETFDQLISGMKLVILAKISGSETQGYTYTVEQLLKGTAGPTLTFGADPQAAVQPGWTEAVVAFSDPTTDDFRAPTVAWHVAADGTIDPEKLQQYPGLPPTLAQMLAFFGVSPSASASASASSAASILLTAQPSIVPTAVATPSPSPGTSPSSPSSSVLLIVGLLALLAIALLVWAVRRQGRA